MEFLIQQISLEAELQMNVHTHTPSVKSTKPASERASHRQSTSRLRLPALPPGTARSPRILAGYSGLDAPELPAKVAQPGLGGFQVPPGFVSSGDLEEDIQQLLEMDGEVLHPASHAVAAPTQCMYTGPLWRLCPVSLTSLPAGYRPMLVCCMCCLS